MSNCLRACWDGPAACFGADSIVEQQMWTEALKGRIQACSLDIQGIDPEECPALAAGSQEKDQRDENVLAQTLELLDEFLKRKSEGQNRKTQDATGKTQDGVDEVEQASIMAHQEALRKATHLRQRKISTELKVETLQKQLRKPSKKSQPKAIPEQPEGREIVEEQLLELTQKLRLLEGNLGETEREAVQVRREWDKKMEEVYKHLFDKQLTAEMFKEHWERGGEPPRILVSKTQDDGRPSGSLRVRAAKLIPSSRSKKKESPSTERDGSVKKSASNNSLDGSPKTGEDSDGTNKSSDSKEMEDARTVTKSRRSPLRIIGDFLESHRGRFGSTHRKAKSCKCHHDRDSSGSQHKRHRGHHSTSTKSRDLHDPPTPQNEYEPSTEHLPDEDGVTASPSITDECRLAETPPWRPMSEVDLAGSCRDMETALLAEEMPLLHTDSGGSCCSEEDVRSLDSGSRLLSDEPDNVVRNEVDPEILAEIEAFEQMAQNYLKRHGHEFPF